MHVLVHACVIELVHVLVTVSSMRMRALSLHGYVCVYVCLYVLTGASAQSTRSKRPAGKGSGRNKAHRTRDTKSETL